MNKILTFLSAILFSISLWAQAPQSFSYQAIVRGANNVLLVNQAIGMKVSILQGSEIGTVVYVETHTPTSNANGLVSISIGAGKGLSGNFTTIDWSKGPYFIKTETDLFGGTNYTFTSTSQLLSVPFALYAANSQSGPKGDKGEQGLPGKDGEVGKDGIQGPIGPKGDTGTIGKQGPIGLTGPAGKDGAQGLIGPKGDTGLKGDKGDQGEPGIQGQAGAQGPKGDIGLKGDKGDQGELGLQGQAGAQGPKGDIGLKGDKGDQGLAGLQGQAGAQGSKGDIGFKGDKGDQGEPGLQGQAGAQGPKGDIGLKGDKGDQGEPGLQGQAGAQGPKGDTGLKGDKGDQGEPGLQGQSGAQGPKGDTGLKGDKGDQGLPGSSKDEQKLSVSATGDTLYLTNGNFVIIPGLSTANSKPTSGNGPNITDTDGNFYKTVYIGTQQWMAENLKVSKYNDETIIPNITDNDQWSSLNTGAWSYYNNDAANNAKYGKLYNWYAVSRTTNGNKNVCLTGWHVPTDDEWTVLIDYLGGASVAGGKMKEVGTTSWNNPNTDATNTSLFTSVPGGFRDAHGGYGWIGSRGLCWSSTEDRIDAAWYRYSDFNSGGTASSTNNKTDGLSVRCLRD